MNENETSYVIDTSAWLALIEDEPGAEIVQDVIERTASGNVKVLVSFMSFMEVFYITLQEREIEEAQSRLRIMESLPITRVESTVSLNISAAKLKAKHRISVADAWIAALALEKKATLVHKDPEFEQLEGQLTVLKLPYKE
jgi:predicted nucleic acid-binding protein